VLGILDSVIIVISLALVVGAVLRATGKKQTDSEYFLAGRDLRWPFIGMSLLASNISAEHVRDHTGRVVSMNPVFCTMSFAAHLQAPMRILESGRVNLSLNPARGHREGPRYRFRAWRTILHG